MGHVIRIAGVFLFAIAIMSLGCARQTHIVKMYSDPARLTASFERLLVISITSSKDQQLAFEDQIVTNIVGAEAEAVASHTMIDAQDGILQEDIDRAANEMSADGILISHVVSVDTTVELKDGREHMLSECRGGDLLDYFLYDREILKEPDSVSLATTIIVITNLYEVQSQKRVWTIQSTCFDKASLAQAIQAEADAIVRQLLIDHLI